MTGSDPTIHNPVPPTWAPDPWRRHELRWWDGTLWTEHVRNGTTPTMDPPPASWPNGDPGWPVGGANPYTGPWPDAAPAHLSFFGAVSRCLRNYVNFSDRAARREYWWFLVFYLVVMFGLVWLEWALFGPDPVGIAGVGWLAIFLPNLAVTARRLHDTNRSGWMMLISIIPLVGPILLLVWTATATDPRPNQWGPPPQ